MDEVEIIKRLAGVNEATTNWSPDTVSRALHRVANDLSSIWDQIEHMEGDPQAQDKMLEILQDIMPKVKMLWQISHRIR